MKKVVEDKALLSSSFSGLVWSDYIDFQIIHFTRPEGGRRIRYTSTTDNALKLFDLCG
jgi:hypothetical protein